MSRRRTPHLRHVFVATDFSSGAGHAVARAEHLPVAEGGAITVVHVLSDRTPRNARAGEEKLAKQALAKVARSIGLALPKIGRRDVKVAVQLCRGQGYVEIIRHARTAAADLVVLGRHGERPVRDMFIGSTAERVIRAGDLPVLVVSRRASRGYERPIVAVDLEDTSRSVVSLALGVLGPDVASATMLHAYRVPFEGFMATGVSPKGMIDIRKEYRGNARSSLVKLQSALGNIGLRWATALVRGDARAAVVTEAVRRRADLVVVGTHGRSGLSHALIGSVAEWIIRAAPCDVLVARPARVSFELP